MMGSRAKRYAQRLVPVSEYLRVGVLVWCPEAIAADRQASVLWRGLGHLSRRLPVGRYRE